MNVEYECLKCGKKYSGSRLGQPLPVTCGHLEFIRALVTVNPKEGMKFDTNKLAWSHFPWKSAKEVMAIFQHGAKKYEWENYLLVENGEERYLSAAFRHLISRANGEVLDKESGRDHYAHCIACLLILLERKQKHD